MELEEGQVISPDEKRTGGAVLPEKFKRVQIIKVQKMLVLERLVQKNERSVSRSYNKWCQKYIPIANTSRQTAEGALHRKDYRILDPLLWRSMVSCHLANGEFTLGANDNASQLLDSQPVSMYAMLLEKTRSDTEVVIRAM